MLPMMRIKQQLLTGTSPAAATGARGAEMARVGGLGRMTFLRIDALIQGATGGTLDLYLQRRIFGTNVPTPANGIWLDWMHFTSLSAGASAIIYTVTCSHNQPNVTIATVGQLSDDLTTGALVLASGAFTGGLPGDEIRLVAVASTGTSAGAAQSVYVTGHELYT